MAKLVTMVTVLALVTPVLCSGQAAGGPARLGVDRDELTRLMAEYEGMVQSTAYSDVLRDEAQAQAELIGERLRIGDFRAGGRIALSIETEGAAPWDTLTIEAGPAINVPTLGLIMLGGVLRSELESHLTAEVGRFVQTPRVRARALIRVLILGVGNPGFHTVPTDLPLSEAVMMAGGPVAGADPGQIRIERGQDELWSVEELLGPVASGRTLDELGLQAGDRIILRADSAFGGAGQSTTLQRIIQSVSYVLIPSLVAVIIN